MVRAKDQFVIEYQALLTANESLSTLERSAKLVWDVLGGRIVAAESGLSFQPAVANAADLVKRIQSSTKPCEAYDIERWRELMSVHPVRSREHRRLRAFVADAALALTGAPAAGPLANLGRNRYSLLLDACLLVAHHAYFALLPKLDDPDYREDRAFLLSAFQRFAESRSEPADRFALLALYFDAMHESQQASDARRAALAATAADAHDFLTVLQSSWSILVERGLLEEAMELLLESYPRVSRRDLEEVGELILQTFRQATAVNGHPQRREKTVKRRKV